MALHVAPPPPPCSQRTHPASQKTTTSVAGVEQDPTFPQRRRHPPPLPSERPGGHGEETPDLRRHCLHGYQRWVLSPHAFMCAL